MPWAAIRRVYTIPSLLVSNSVSGGGRKYRLARGALV